MCDAHDAGGAVAGIGPDGVPAIMHVNHAAAVAIANPAAAAEPAAVPQIGVRL